VLRGAITRRVLHGHRVDSAAIGRTSTATRRRIPDAVVGEANSSEQSSSRISNVVAVVPRAAPAVALSRPVHVLSPSIRMSSRC